MNQEKRPPTERAFIGKPKAQETPPQPLMSTLPKEPNELSYAELLESYYKLALRCFNAENSLDVAKELIKNLEKITKDQREDIRDILDEVEDQTCSVNWEEVKRFKLKYPELVNRIYGEN